MNYECWYGCEDPYCPYTHEPAPLALQQAHDIAELTDFLLTGETRRCQGDTSSTTSVKTGRGLPQQAPPTSANDNEEA